MSDFSLIEKFNKFVQEYTQMINNYHYHNLALLTNFVEQYKQYLREAEDNRAKKFHVFLYGYKKLMKEKEEEFKKFLKQYCEMIVDEIRNLDPRERKVFEILSMNECKINLFEYFDIQEGHYRDFLAWLLNSNSCHALGNLFTKIFVNYIVKTCGDQNEDKTPFSDDDFTNTIVQREKYGIDLLIVSDKFFCAIEMKIRTKEGRNQLKRYDEALNNSKLNRPRQFKIYLDPKLNPDPNKDNQIKLSSDEWKVMDWWRLILLISELYVEIENNKTINPYFKFAIAQFITQIITKLIKFFNGENRKHIENNLRRFRILSCQGG